MNIIQLKSYLNQSRGRLFSVFYHALALIGLSATVFMIFYGGQLVRGESDEVTGAFDRGPYRDVTVSESAVDSENLRNRVLATYLSRRYRIAGEVIENWVGAAFRAGQKIGLDPLLILSVMAIESRFNPIAESEFGAKGLMQVMPQYHQDKVAEYGGDEAMLNPVTNILIGAAILKECIRRGGGLEAGLQLYAGAFGDTGSQYSQKVMAEKDRLVQALRRPSAQSPRQAAASATVGAAI